MKIGRELFLVYAILLTAGLACNIPGVNSAKNEPTATPVVPTSISTEVVIDATATTAPTDTPIPPTETPTISPELTLTKNSNCRVGPSSFYNIVDQVAQGKVLNVTGRNEENTWWQVTNPTGRTCWIFSENATPNTDFGMLQIANAPALPGVPLNFVVANLDCQPAVKKYTVTLSWSSGGGETAFRLFRDSKQIIELKAGKTNFKDARAPVGKRITYELEAVNGNGTSDKAVQFVAECK